MRTGIAHTSWKTRPAAVSLRALVCVLALALGLPAAAHANEALWSLLKAGGQVVLIRHAVTTPGVGDPPGMTLEDCRTQRNLSPDGVAQARTLGRVFRERGIEVGSLQSSPWCRCLETARLAFGRAPEPIAALGNVFEHPERTEAQLAALRPRVGRKPASGNTVMVTHGSVISALTGVSPDTAELVVLSPQPDGSFKLAGRLAPAAR